MSRMSIATIDKPEFINLQPLDINPLMSSCEIKVFYVGQNRNRSYISKDVAMEMSKTLRGAPIVGYYREQIQDFGDHGEQLVMDVDGFKTNCLTKPYGFVSPDAKVWFQKFEEEDDFGNTIIREYLMTTGYLWTGQYEEAQQVFDDGGKPHSMELDEKTLHGNWSEDIKSGMDFFIINDAVFSKLCILGDDIEPCFEGSTVTKPEVSATFSKINDEKFTKTLYTMMQELKTVLEGGTMTTQDIKEEVKTEYTEEKVQDNSVELQTENIDSNIEQPTSDFEKKEEEEKKEEAPSDDKKEEAAPSDEKKEEDEEDKEDKKPATKSALDEATEALAELTQKYEALSEKFNALQDSCSALEKANEELAEYKKNVEDAKKDELISEFSKVLTEEEMKDVVSTKEVITTFELESKLSMLESRKRRQAEKEIQHEEQPADTYTVNIDDASASLPDWVKAALEFEKTL